MKRLHTILVPTDLSEHSRRALSYGCWLAAEENAVLIALHVANEFTAWEYFSEDLAFLEPNGKSWPGRPRFGGSEPRFEPVSRAEPVGFTESRDCDQARCARLGAATNRCRCRR